MALHVITHSSRVAQPHESRLTTKVPLEALSCAVRSYAKELALRTTAFGAVVSVFTSRFPHLSSLSALDLKSRDYISLFRISCCCLNVVVLFGRGARRVSEANGTNPLAIFQLSAKSSRTRYSSQSYSVNININPAQAVPLIFPFSYIFSAFISAFISSPCLEETIPVEKKRETILTLSIFQIN